MTDPVLNYNIPQRLPRLRLERILLLIIVLLSLAEFLALGIGGFLMAHLWHQYAAGAALDPMEENLSEVLMAAGDFTSLAMILVLISLAYWMYRAHVRLRRARPNRARFSSGQAFYAWVLPYSFMIRPFEVMKEIYVGSLDLPPQTFTPICGCWWGFWLLAEFLMLTEYFAITRSRDRGADLYIAYGLWNAASAVPVLISGVSLIVQVYRIDRAQAKWLMKTERP